jgi:hypothetical protein
MVRWLCDILATTTTKIRQVMTAQSMWTYYEPLYDKKKKNFGKILESVFLI